MTEHQLAQASGAEAGPPTLAVEGSCATIRLNRPAVHNRIEPADLVVLAGLMDRVEADRSLRAVVLTAGGRSFSSGFHIGELGVGDVAPEHRFDRVADRLEELRLPTICALNGSVYGGSTDFALACDFRIGVEGTTLTMPAARLGLHYYPGGMRRYVSRLGLNAAKRLFMTAERIGTADLLRMGFLTEVVPTEQLAARTAALAALLAANAPLAVRGMKAALNGIARGDADVNAIDAAIEVCRTSEDLREGRAAWLEKRPPVFRGR